MEKILRYNPNAEVIAESRRVYGCAIKFESESVDMGFIETIHRGAVTQELLDNSDIFALVDHDKSKVLARSCYGKGSLKLELHDDGLYYEFDAPNTVLGDEVLEHIRRGEFGGSSFAFSINGNNDEHWYHRLEDGKLMRDIFHISGLYDVSCVYNPAYEATSCDTRAKHIIEKSDIINVAMDSKMKELDNYII